MNFHDQQHHRHSDSNKEKLPLIGIFLIGLGFIFLLRRMDLIPAFWIEIIISWQSLLIFVGLLNIFKSHDRFPGIILVLVGSVFLLPKIVNIPLGLQHLTLPIVLISIGAFILLKSRNYKSFHPFNKNNNDNIEDYTIQEIAVFGGGKRIITNKNLKGGTISAIFGGLELDLSEADFEGDIMVLEVSCIFGGVVIISNQEWDVQIQVASILGGFDDKRKLYKRDNGVMPRKRLILKGTVIFGGGEVKAY